MPSLETILKARRSLWRRPIIEIQFLGEDFEPICQPIYTHGKLDCDRITAIFDVFDNDSHVVVHAIKTCLNGIDMPIRPVDQFMLCQLNEFHYSSKFTDNGFVETQEL